MLNDIASNTSFFGIFITGVAYVLACAIQKRFKSSILNPLLVSCVILIIFMLVSGIDYNVYLYGKPKADGTYDGTGAIFFQNMLTPTTVCLAIPLYEKLVYLKKYPVAIIGGILAGMFACLGGVLVLSMAFGLDHTQYVTLLPKSITTAIGMGLSEELGGMVSVTVASIIVTGLFGNVAAAAIFKLFRIKHPVAIGVSCGTGAHAMGTSRAREFGEIEEAMSGLSIAVCGLLTVVGASIFCNDPVLNQSIRLRVNPHRPLLNAQTVRIFYKQNRAPGKLRGRGCLFQPILSLPNLLHRILLAQLFQNPLQLSSAAP